MKRRYVPTSFFCSKCKRVVTEMASTYHPTEKGRVFSAVRRHYAEYHPDKQLRPRKFPELRESSRKFGA